MAFAIEKSTVMGTAVLSSMEQSQATFSTVRMPSFAASRSKTMMAVVALDRRELSTKPLALLKQMARQKGINGTTRDQLIDALSGGPSSFRSQPSYSSFAAAPASASVSADESVLQSKTLSELRALAKQKGVRGDTKAEIIKLLLAAGVSAVAQPSSFSASDFGSFTPAVAASVAQESVEEYERRLQKKPLSKLRAVARLRGIAGGSRVDLVRKLLAYHKAGGAPSSSSSSSFGSFASAPATSAPAISNLDSLPLGELRAMAKARGLRGDTRKELIKLLSNAGGASATLAAASGPSYTNGATTSYSSPAPSAALSEKVLVTKPLSQLRALAAQRGIRGNTRQELIRALTR